MLAVLMKGHSRIEAGEFHAFEAKTPPPGAAPDLDDEEEGEDSSAIEAATHATGKCAFLHLIYTRNSDYKNLPRYWRFFARSSTRSSIDDR